VLKSTIIIDDTTTSDRLAELLRNIKDRVTKVYGSVKMAGLGLSDGQIWSDPARTTAWCVTCFYSSCVLKTGH
jgi:hypothetical protein